MARRLLWKSIPRPTTTKTYANSSIGQYTHAAHHLRAALTHHRHRRRWPWISPHRHARRPHHRQSGKGAEALAEAAAEVPRARLEQAERARYAGCAVLVRPS